MSNMKSIKKYIPFILGLFVLVLTSCHRNDDEGDDLPQEEMSNILLLVKDEVTQITKVYNYQINGSSFPTMELKNGHIYTVEVQFKNGTEDMNEDILSAVNEHFLVFNFPNSNIELTRLNGGDLRKDGYYVGLKTKWVVNNAVNNNNPAQLILTLYHASLEGSVSDESSVNGTGKIYGKQSGGETDAQAVYNIIN